jgi:hypothetical protein
MNWIYGKKKWLMSFNPDKTEIIAFQKILISLLMENQCPLPLLINT